MTTLLQDLKYGARMMGRTPVVTIVAILSLALGIAANAATFSLIHAWMFEPFPYGDQDELVMYLDGKLYQEEFYEEVRAGMDLDPILFDSTAWLMVGPYWE